jgi:hypothetical protein
VVRTPESTRIDPQLVAIFRESDVPLVSSESAGVVMKGNMAYADRDRLDEAIRSWEEGQKVYEREKKEQLLVDIFQEYRTERGKEMKKGG